MCRIEWATQADRADLTALWLAAFPTDRPDDVTDFWECGFSPEQAMVCRVECRIVSMAFCLPQRVYDATLGYVFGVATLPAYRGQGYAGRLLREMARAAAANGLDGLFLHPATPTLEGFYAALGYRPAFYIEETTLLRREMTGAVPSPMEALPFPPPKRPDWFRSRGITPVDWNDCAWAYSLSEEYLVAEDWMGFCALEGDHLTVRELLCKDEALPVAYAALCDRYAFATCTIRRPTTTAAHPFGMMIPLSPVGEGLFDRSLYMGPAME